MTDVMLAWCAWRPTAVWPCCCSITDGFLMSGVLTSCRQLSKLNLSKTNISDKGSFLSGLIHTVQHDCDMICLTKIHCSRLSNLKIVLFSVSLCSVAFLLKPWWLHCAYCILLRWIHQNVLKRQHCTNENRCCLVTMKIFKSNCSARLQLSGCCSRLWWLLYRYSLLAGLMQLQLPQLILLNIDETYCLPDIADRLLGCPSLSSVVFRTLRVASRDGTQLS